MIKYLELLAILSLIIFFTSLVNAEEKPKNLENPTKILYDNKAGITYYLESDKRHITAVDSKGSQIWRTDPFIDAKLELYRVEKPIIQIFDFPSDSWWNGFNGIKQFGKSSDFISIGYNSSQFGLLSKKEGKFIFLGQD